MRGAGIEPARGYLHRILSITYNIPSVFRKVLESDIRSVFKQRGPVKRFRTLDPNRTFSRHDYTGITHKIFKFEGEGTPTALVVAEIKGLVKKIIK